MINHARTLLLNDPVNRPPLGVFGEEYIPEEAPKLPLDQTMGAVHSILFGVSPEHLYQNAIMRIYMRALHAIPQTDEFARGLDPRITYMREEAPLIPTQVVQVTPDEGNKPVLVGAPSANTRAGLAVFLYEVTAEGNPATVKAVDSISGQRFSAVYPDGVMLSCGSKLVFSRGNPAGRWEALVKAPLAVGIPEIVTLLRGSVDAGKLMASGPEEFRQLWATATSVESLAGLLAMWIYRAEEERVNAR